MDIRIRKLIFVLLVFIVPIVVCACDRTPPVKAPESIEIYATDTDMKKLEKGDTFEVACEILPYDADQNITWSVSDSHVARISEDGIVTALNAGTFKIYATSTVDDTIVGEYKNEITVIDNTENYSKIDEVIEYLKELYPTNMKVTGYFELATSYSELPDVSINWTSSNPSVLPVNDLYTRGDTDKTVTLTARVRCGNVQKEYAFDAIVESSDKVQLKNLKDHKLVFMYLYGGLQSFTRTDIQGIDVINLSFALLDNNTHKLRLNDVNRKYDSVIKAHSYGIRVVLSIGGWGADGFSQACATQETRKVLIDDIMATIKQYHYDGIDLDWEYPTSRSAGIASSTNDKVNFTAFCSELRAAMDEYDPNLLLTAAVSGSDTKYYEVAKLNAILDYWHIMTYEYNNSSSVSYDSSYVQTKNGIDKWIKAGATNTKVVLGITFYGSIYKIDKNVVTDSSSLLGAKASNPQHPDLSEVYPKYINNSNFKKSFDQQNGMAYAYTMNAVDGYYTFVSYDNAQSLKMKAEFIKTAGLAGIMSWELGGDTDARDQLKLVCNAMIKYAN